MIKGNLTVLNGAMSMDGGSKSLLCEDESGSRIEIFLPQHGIKENFRKDFIPGRLHMNNLALGLRSPEELEIIGKLKDAPIRLKSPGKKENNVSSKRIVLGEDIQNYFSAIDQSPEQALKQLVTEIVDFVKSEKYLDVAGEMDARK